MFYVSKTPALPSKLLETDTIKRSQKVNCFYNTGTSNAFYCSPANLWALHTKFDYLTPHSAPNEYEL